MLRAWTCTCFEMSEASPLPEAPPADTLGCSGEPSAPRSGPGSVPRTLMPWHGNTPHHAVPHHAITHHAMPHSWGQHTGHTKPSHTCAGPAAPHRAKGKRACGRRRASSDTPAGPANAGLWDHVPGQAERWPRAGTSGTYRTNGSGRREVVLLLPGVLHKAGRVFNPLQSRLRSLPSSER